MQLLIFRHGIAEDRGPDGTDDSRRLTDEGKSKTREAAVGLSCIAPRPDVILNSPLVRAMQTAEIVGDVFDVKPRVCSALGMGPLEDVLRELRKMEEEVVMVIGHEPQLSSLAEILCTGVQPTGFIQMKKAGCIAVETPINEGKARVGKLLWIATPAMLRAMAGR
ncbi:MAG: phosphohistidine phosphatase SixA [Phycisphaeraceae bacterium]